MNDLGVTPNPHSHQRWMKDGPKEVFFLSSFLELGNKSHTQNSRTHPFAHLADALGGLYSAKQNVLMQDGCAGANLEKDQDTLRKGVDLKPYPAAMRAMSSESRQLYEEKTFDMGVATNDVKDSMQREMHARNPETVDFDSQDVSKKGFDKQVVQVKSVYSLSDAPYPREELWIKSKSLNAVDNPVQSIDMQLTLPDSLSFTVSTKVSRSRKQGRVHAEQLWEYVLTSEPVPNVLSEKSLFGLRRTSQMCLSGSTCVSKLTLSKISMQSTEKQITPATKEFKLNDSRVRTQKRKEAETERKQQVQASHVLKQLLCGGFAGVVSRTAVAPLDLIKTYLITSHGLGGSKKSALIIFKEIVDHGGWQGLFRGNMVNCLRVAPSKAIELCVFETVRRALNREDHPFKNAAATIAGGAAGMAGTIATYPLELIRTRLSVQPELYSSLSQAIKKIANDEGFLAFYSGLSPSLVGAFPYAATNYFVYDGLRTAYCRSTGQKNVPTIPTLMFGAVAAAASSAVTYPLEVARRQMQLSLTGALANKSTVQVILDVYKHEGFLGLYRGLGTTWLKLIPAAGISFVCYETARLALRIDDASLVKPEETILADQEPQ